MSAMPQTRIPHVPSPAIAKLTPYVWPHIPIRGDLVLTPTNRVAMVTGPAVDGRLTVRYRDNTQGVVGSEYADVFPKWLRPVP